MIHAVVFDLFETLVTELDSPVRRAGSLASELGVDARRTTSIAHEASSASDLFAKRVAMLSPLFT